MSAIDEIIDQIPLNQLASELGVDEATAEQATRQALPALLGGLDANAKDPARAASLADALGQHDPSLITGGVDLSQVDRADGEKIVGHVFGPHKEAVADQLGATGGGLSSDLMKKLLPLLAPIVLSWITSKMASRSGGSSASGGSGGLSDVLGNVLGGAVGGSGSGDLLSNVLGGLLGGGRR